MELLEREAELSHLDGALSGAASGRGSVVLVHGDAGIGKTSLVRCFAEAHAADAEFLWGVCDDLLTPDALVRCGTSPGAIPSSWRRWRTTTGDGSFVSYSGCSDGPADPRSWSSRTRSGRTRPHSIWRAEPYRLQIEGRWHAAAEVWKKLGMPYERAGALADGDVAAEMSAIDALDELGAAPLATRLRRDLRRQGVTRVPRRRGAHGDRRAGLTGRQHEVLTLLAEGLTNAAIADRLFISVRTAEHHVAAVMGSLAATSRTEAVEIAVARGIIETAVTGVARRPSRR